MYRIYISALEAEWTGGGSLKNLGNFLFVCFLEVLSFSREIQKQSCVGFQKFPEMGMLREILFFYKNFNLFKIKTIVHKGASERLFTFVLFVPVKMFITRAITK